VIGIKQKITVVIPAKNEEKSIGFIIKKIFSVFKKYRLGKVKILVISDSKDRTNEIARKLGAVVIRGMGTGLGSAMYRGINAAVKNGADIIVSIDADGQFDPEELPKVLTPVLKKEADLVLGSRFLKPNSIKYKMPLVNKIGNSLLSWVVRQITKLPITDAQTGYRAMTRELAESLEMIGTHTYVQETIIDAAQKNFRIKEVPVVFKKRKYGGSKVVASIKRYAIWTLPTLMLRAGLHMIFFTFLGVVLFLVGCLLGIYLVYIETSGTPIGINRYPFLMLVVLLISSGLELFFFGFLLNMMIHLKSKLDFLAKK
jgi:glycosyltransferase involved in cell wall biosynthesis